MNNSASLLKILSGISRTLNIANQVIPLYRDAKPFFNNVRNVYSLFRGNNLKDNIVSKENEIIIENEVNKKNPDNKKKKTLSSNNNPQFFI